MSSDSGLPHLRSQSTLLAEMEARLRDTGNARYSEAEIYRGLSDALLRWEGRVFVPYTYTISGGWVNGSHEYALPAYIGERIQPQRRIVVPYVTDDAPSYEFVWADVLGWTVESDGAGGRYLRLEQNEGVAGATSDARILYWSENGPLPSTVPTLNTTITSATTTLVLSGIVDVGRAGYVRVENEWMQYVGRSDDGTRTSLLNVVRGVDGSTAAAHTASSSMYVYFGVALPNLRLLENLWHQALANVYAYSLTNVNETDRQRQEWNMRYLQQLADEFWPRWTPNLSPRLKLSRRSTGWEW